MQTKLFNPKLEQAYKARKHYPAFGYLPVKRPSNLKRFKRLEKNPGYLVVYFLFVNDKLQYVGITKNLDVRLRKHRHKGVEYDEFAFKRLPGELEKPQALRIEAGIISAFKPPKNIYKKN